MLIAEAHTDVFHLPFVSQDLLPKAVELILVALVEDSWYYN